MPVCVALLRGINVGGRHKVAMADLRALVADLGHANVQTYINSGNVLFDSDRAEDELVHELANVLQDRFGFAIPVVVRTARELDALPADHPLAAHAEERMRHVAFLDAAPADETLAAFDHERYLPDRLRVIGREAYLAYPNGSGRSRLTLDVIERALEVTATGRNWPTVTKLRELAAAR